MVSALCQHEAGPRNPWRLTGTPEALHLHHRRMRRAFGFFSSILRLPVGADGSEGGGGAGGSGNGSGNPGGSEQPVGLTEDKVNELINKAIGPRISKLEQKQTQALEAFGAKLTESITSTLTETLSKFEPDPGKGKEPKPNATDLSQNPDFRALKKQNEDFAKQLEQERNEKLEAKAKARAEALNRKVQDELSALGVADAVSARKLIVQGDALASYEDDDSDVVVFKDEEGGALPLKKGLESWAKSAVGKRFMPASGASGSGERPRGGREGSNGAGKSGAALSDVAVGESIASHFGIPVS